MVSDDGFYLSIKQISYSLGQIFKGYTIQTLAEALSFVQDLKLGHYIKVPPRATFVGMLLIRVSDRVD